MSEIVPLTVWPVPVGPAHRHRPGGGLPVDAVVAQVLARYGGPESRVVTHGDQHRCEPAVGEFAPTLADLVVVVGCRRSDAFRLRVQLVAPGGLLVAVLPSSTTVDLVAVVARARSVGLRYVQHNVAFPVPLPGTASSADRRSAARPATRGHTRIHTDVLVFQRPHGDG